MNLRDYQQEVHEATINHFKLKASPDMPAVVSASVGAGKSVLIAAAAKHVSDRGGRVIILQRQGELCDQNSTAALRFGLKNSIYSASIGVKSMYYPVVFSTEGTAARAIGKEPGLDKPFDLILVDEMQMVDFTKEESQFMRIISHCKSVNPKVRIAGYSGSPYRGTESVIGPFWKQIIGDISTDFLTERGFLVPLEFDYHDKDAEIDFSQFELKGDHNGNDYSEDEINRIYQGEVHKTFAICEDVVKKTRDGNGVLIFAGSKLHCDQVKHGLELAGIDTEQIRIVTDDTPNKEREEARQAARSGRCKFFINIGVASCGWDVPYWSYAVYLRPVGSLVFLTQSIGRVLRPYLTEDQAEEFNSPDATPDSRKAILLDSKKPVCTVFDYAGVMDRLGHLYNSPMLEQAALEKSKREGATIQCPSCSTENSEHARRCIGISLTSTDGRCEHFWQSQECRKCGTLNDVTAQECRSCHAMLRDPANALLNKAYTDAELTAVRKMEVIATANGGLLVKYIVDDPHEDKGHPTEFFSVTSEGGKRIFYNKFLKEHLNCPQWRSRARGMTAQALCKNQAMFDVPCKIAWRLNDRGYFVVGKKVFLSGRIAEDNAENV